MKKEKEYYMVTETGAVFNGNEIPKEEKEKMTPVIPTVKSPDFSGSTPSDWKEWEA